MLSLSVAVSRDASEILNRAIENFARVSMHEDETRKNKTSAAKAIFFRDDFGATTVRLRSGQEVVP
jgi:hypothetical protein